MRASWLMALAALASTAPQARDIRPEPTLPAVVAVGERVTESVPASVDTVQAEAVPVAVHTSVSETLRRIPGVMARDRQNLAQDVQVTVRGFGARTSFGVRGLRIYVDGIPASMPDGQGQVSHVPLAALEAVTVLRGPFSALYGNASGGVIQFFSKAPAMVPEIGTETALGADGLQRADLAWSGPWSRDGDNDQGGYRVDTGHLESDGYRHHSRARRDLAQARLTFAATTGTRFALTANAMNLRAQDPQGLSLEQVRDTPRAASTGALAFDTGKTVRQQQAGARLEHDLPRGGSSLALALHAGRRSTWQMLSVPVAAQTAAGSSGGVVDLDRDYGGLEARWSLDTSLGQRPFALSLGTELQRASEQRLGFENFVGDTLGVVGRLRREQRDRSTARDAFVEARWRWAPRWQANAGLRHSQIDFHSRDRYIAPGNPDDSGAMRHAFTSPAAGLLFEPGDGIELYLNAGRGFESPSASELAYRPDGGSGLNDTLRPARSDSFETGFRLRRGEHRFGLAGFDSRTRDELVVATNQGGRSTYRNAARTTRRGWELSAEGPLGHRWRYALAWTALDARHGDETAGRRLPGTAQQAGWAELRWMPAVDTTLFVSANGSSRIAADDANETWAPGQATIDLGIERRWRAGALPWMAGLRLDNVLDRARIGSVIVNASGGGYFEPAPGRGLMFVFGIGSAAATP